MTHAPAHSAAWGRVPDAGVTLVEVLVVLALIGILAGVVGLSFGSGPRGDVAGQEADLLVARLNRAADEVMLTGVPMGFVWAAEGYRFDLYDGERWQPHDLPVLAAPHLLGGATRITDAAGAMVLSRDMDPGAAGPLTLELLSGAGPAEVIRFDGLNAARLEGTP
ncbi:prepilin-type N-terminal cleavage/methylation domain-containing protein [Sulfitobacter sp. AS92]|uniref:prepilin-type N-terminal cleavage/methylation domain-containing protein n=1 Tax=Sulfitobacter sp. AS92 TaxID=3135783 RepID=UPI003176DBB6